MIPAGMFAPDAFVTTGRSARRAAASNFVVVVLPFVAETKTTRRPSTSLPNASGYTTVDDASADDETVTATQRL